MNESERPLVKVTMSKGTMNKESSRAGTREDSTIDNMVTRTCDSNFGLYFTYFLLTGYLIPYRLCGCFTLLSWPAAPARSDEQKWIHSILIGKQLPNRVGIEFPMDWKRRSRGARHAGAGAGNWLY